MGVYDSMESAPPGYDHPDTGGGDDFHPEYGIQHHAYIAQGCPECGWFAIVTDRETRAGAVCRGCDHPLEQVAITADHFDLPGGDE